MANSTNFEEVDDWSDEPKNPQKQNAELRVNENESTHHQPSASGWTTRNDCTNAAEVADVKPKNSVDQVHENAGVVDDLENMRFEDDQEADDSAGVTRYTNFMQSKSSKCVQVRNVNDRLAREELADALGQFGNIKRIIMPRNFNARTKRGVAHVEFTCPNAAALCVKAKKVYVKNSTLRLAVSYKSTYWKPNWGTVKKRESSYAVRECSEVVLGGPVISSGGQADSAKEDDEGVHSFATLPDLCLKHIFSYLSIKERIVCERVAQRWCTQLRSDWACLRKFSFGSFDLPFGHSIKSDAYRSILDRLKFARFLTSVDCSSKNLFEFRGEHLDTLLAYQFEHLIDLNLSNTAISWKEVESLVRAHPSAFARLEKLSVSHCNQLREKGMWYIVRYCRNLRTLEAENVTGLRGNTCLHMLSKRLERISLSHCRDLTDSGIAGLEVAFRSNVPIAAEKREKEAFNDKLIDNSHQLTIELNGCSGITDTNFRVLIETAGPRIGVLKLTGSILQRMTYMSSCNALQELCLRRCYNFDDDDLRTIVSSCSQLTSLDVAACVQLTDAGFATIGCFDNLRSLRVSYLRLLTGASISLIATLRSLHTLEAIAMYHCVDEGPNAFESLPNAVENGSLRHLELCSNDTAVSNALIIRLFDAINSAAARCVCAAPTFNDPLRVVCGQTVVCRSNLPSNLLNSSLIYVDESDKTDYQLFIARLDDDLGEIDDIVDNAESDAEGSWFDGEDYLDGFDEDDYTDVSEGGLLPLFDSNDEDSEAAEHVARDDYGEIDTSGQADVNIVTANNVDAEWLDQVENEYDEFDDLDGNDCWDEDGDDDDADYD